MQTNSKDSVAVVESDGASGTRDTTSTGSGKLDDDSDSVDDPAMHQVEVPDKVPSGVVPFVPEGYKVLTIKEGDLNLDEHSDMIVILKRKREDTINSYDAERPLLILIGEGEGKLKQAGRNDKTVLCYHCGGVFGDPLAGITIKNGYFSVEHYGGSNWRWSRVITYKYSKEEKKWYLSRDGSESFNATENPEKVESTIKTTKDFGKVAFEDFDINK